MNRPSDKNKAQEPSRLESFASTLDDWAVVLPPKQRKALKAAADILRSQPVTDAVRAAEGYFDGLEKKLTAKINDDLAAAMARATGLDVESCGAFIRELDSPDDTGSDRPIASDIASSLVLRISWSRNSEGRFLQKAAAFHTVPDSGGKVRVGESSREQSLDDLPREIQTALLGIRDDAPVVFQVFPRGA